MSAFHPKQTFGPVSFHMRTQPDLVEAPVLPLRNRLATKKPSAIHRDL
jgi:hypothetical protein